MEKFNLSEWPKYKSRKVVTRDGREVTIEKTDIHIHGMSHMILGKYSDIYEIWHSNGRINYTGSDCNLDLFFADEEEESRTIEIPFGAKDYEFIRDEYCIPEGCEARIEGNKVIIEKVQKEEELTEFEKMLRYVLECYSGHEFASESEIETLKLNAKSLLNLSRKELKPEFDKEMDKMLAETDKVVYQKGKQDALKDLPKLEKTKDTIDPTIPVMYTYAASKKSYVEYNGYKVCINELFESLPKEE